MKRKVAATFGQVLVAMRPYVAGPATGLDLSTTDIAVFELLPPTEGDTDKYIILPYFWIPEDNLALRVRRDHAPYDVWQLRGFLETAEGNVVHYGFIESFIGHRVDGAKL